MDIRPILDDLAAGRITADQAQQKLASWPTADLGFARLDNHRDQRTGFVEVVFCGGKTPAQAAAILKHQAAQHRVLLATHADQDHADAVRGAVPDIEYHPIPRILRRIDPQRHVDGPTVAVVSAGTSDMPVAEEAALTLETIGHTVLRHHDVGVAGLHRVAAVRDELERCGTVIVVAGMDGALPSVVGGLLSRPVVAVPTSIGYGASFNGLAALLSMLSSCAPGITVVNIDNGFGAAMAASRICRVPPRPSPSP